MLYLYEIEQTSKAHVLIDANNTVHAEQALERWRDDYDVNEELQDFLNAACNEDTKLVNIYRNEEAYARDAKVLADYRLKADEPEEAQYDLYIMGDKYDNEASDCQSHIWRSSWEQITMDKVLDILRDFNKRYILIPNPGIPYECYKLAREHQSVIMAYRIKERRKETAANG